MRRSRCVWAARPIPGLWVPAIPIVFADGSRLVYTSGSDEHFVLTLADDMVRGGKVRLTYSQQLVE